MHVRATAMPVVQEVSPCGKRRDLDAVLKARKEEG